MNVLSSSGYRILNMEGKELRNADKPLLSEFQQSKQSFFEKADGLVGICRNAASGHSNAFTLDLSMYDDHAVA